MSRSSAKLSPSACEICRVRDDGVTHDARLRLRAGWHGRCVVTRMKSTNTKSSLATLLVALAITFASITPISGAHALGGNGSVTPGSLSRSANARNSRWQTQRGTKVAPRRLYTSGRAAGGQVQSPIAAGVNPNLSLTTQQENATANEGQAFVQRPANQAGGNGRQVRGMRTGAFYRNHRQWSAAANQSETRDSLLRNVANDKARFSPSRQTRARDLRFFKQAQRNEMASFNNVIEATELHASALAARADFQSGNANAAESMVALSEAAGTAYTSALASLRTAQDGYQSASFPTGNLRVAQAVRRLEALREDVARVGDANVSAGSFQSSPNLDAAAVFTVGTEGRAQRAERGSR